MNISVPQFVIELNRDFDRKIFLGFYRSDSLLIEKYCPQIKSVRDIEAALTYVYVKRPTKILTTVKWLQSQVDTLQEIARLISGQLSWDWPINKKVTILPTICPIYPRFIETATFAVPYGGQHNFILQVCAHELTHLLYFAKLESLLGKTPATEFPSDDWLISEIIAPVIVNTKKIQALVNSRDQFFSPQPNLIDKKKIKQIQRLYTQNNDLLVFRKQAQKIIGRIDENPHSI